MFQKILIANRSEIAIRIMRAANELGIKTVAVYAEEDKLGLHRFKADESYLIGQGMGPVSAYLSISEMIRVAKLSGATAIHPGYGFLSENPNFVEACESAGLTFIGPSAATMRMLGDKARAREVAIKAHVPVIPASAVLSDDLVGVEAIADEIGYPLMLKASWGGGGRGMRPILSRDVLREKIQEGRREALNAFGNEEGYLEKMITKARHVEVQILGDHHDGLYHLYERDCSLQRRHQKVIERAPAPYLDDEARALLCEYAMRIGRYVGYNNAGTVEFLQDIETGKFYFIEVNPRIQVEHTVTEEVTGIDIVRAQILIAAGQTLAQATGTDRQEDIYLNGHALQCRITTEDPQNSFVPDYGRITAYRSASGMGIRLDGGTAYSGAVITRYYDSLLVKLTAWAPTPMHAIRRMDRALREFRVRGVSTNIVFLENLLKDPVFQEMRYTTNFIDNTPALLEFRKRRDRASRVLNYIADVTINGNPEAKNLPKPELVNKLPVKLPSYDTALIGEGTKQILDRHGPKGVSEWMLAQNKLLVTDTTMRDGHQSVLATRMRSFDMVRIAPVYAQTLGNLFSVECWGGATFDVAYRFLQECPWQRLRDLRVRMPNILLQMLLRGANGVGYTSYPDNVVRAFVAQAAETGVDLFRVFDSLNWVENMRVAMDAVNEAGRICEGTICYTGDITNPDAAKYTLRYYVKMAQDLADAGAHVIGIKDMAGLVKPDAARLLVRAIKEAVALPVHFHTHDTSGLSAASVLAAAEAGADAIDAAMDSFSGGTSQPCLGSIVEALRYNPRDTGLDIRAVRAVSDYWENVRDQYRGFESGMRAPTSEVYQHEMPGGQFTNLKAQARSLGLEHRWSEISKTYAEVNDLFGDITKVTPSSKVVGDMALLLVSQGLLVKDVLKAEVDFSFPESVLDMLRGNLGQPPGGFPKDLIKIALRSEEPNLERAGKNLAPVDLGMEKTQLQQTLGEDVSIDNEDFLGYLMYPRVFLDYMEAHKSYGPVRTLPTLVYFYGMQPGDEISAEIDPGKTLEIRLLAIGAPNDAGEVKLFFELNGQERTVRVRNKTIKPTRPSRPKITGAKGEIGAPMPGIIAALVVSPGQEVKEGDLILTVEAMKMETGLYAEADGHVQNLYVECGDQIEAKDLLAVIG